MIAEARNIPISVPTLAAFCFTVFSFHGMDCFFVLILLSLLMLLLMWLRPQGVAFTQDSFHFLQVVCKEVTLKHKGKSYSFSHHGADVLQRFLKKRFLRFRTSTTPCLQTDPLNFMKWLISTHFGGEKYRFQTHFRGSKPHFQHLVYKEVTLKHKEKSYIFALTNPVFKPLSGLSDNL